MMQCLAVVKKPQPCLASLVNYDFIVLSRVNTERNLGYCTKELSNAFEMIVSGLLM